MTEEEEENSQKMKERWKRKWFHMYINQMESATEIVWMCTLKIVDFFEENTCVVFKRKLLVDHWIGECSISNLGDVLVGRSIRHRF